MICLITSIFAFILESPIDSTRSSTTLSEVTVRSAPRFLGTRSLPDMDKTLIFLGKKTEEISLAKLDANLANQSFRQVFNRTPGLHVVESDPSGFNTSIAIRGLSTNRSWDFNMRQNGYDMTPDPMGYNEAYYTPALEWVDKIQLIRGASSLAFGPQVGGMLNYVLEAPVFEQALKGLVQQSVGSWNLSSSLLKLKAGNQRMAWLASHQFRQGNGFRPNSAFDSNQSYARLDLKSGKQNRLIFELTRSEVLSKQGGGLSEAQFVSNPKFSNRSRNYFQAHWLMPVLTYQFQVNPRLQGDVQVLGIFSGRSQVGFTKSNDVVDLPLADGAYATRQLDTDRYTSFGLEGRFGYQDSLAGRPFFLSTGFRLFDGKMQRGQLGTANASVDFTLQPIQDFTRKFSFENQNLAFYIENLLKINPRLAWTFGLRGEFIRSFATQELSNPISSFRSRQFLLMGTAIAYRINSDIEGYVNFSQSFRPVSFSDLIPSATTDQVDPNLKDANAQNIDLGFKGQISTHLRFDISYFLLKYQNRIGQISQKNELNQSYLYRTNVGESTSHGLEAYVEWDPLATILDHESRLGHPSFFVSTSLLQANYGDFPLANGQNLRGKNIEYAPQEIIRTGITYRIASMSLTYQISSTSAVFSDAQNTIIANPQGTIGLIPAYQIHDVSFSYRQGKHVYMKGSLNNVLNASYFTRRGTGAYPGFGILPAELRNISFTFAYTW